MNDPSELPPDIRTLIDRERDLPVVPGPARARVLARARAALVAGRVTAPLAPGGIPRVRIGAVAIGLVCGAAAAAAAYELGTHNRPEQASEPRVQSELVPATNLSRPVATEAPAVTREPPLEPSEEPVERTQARSPAASSVTPARQPDPTADELALLQRARSAVGRRDFSAALGFIGEHSRRFSRGRLVEEREALRVRSLSGMGRKDEARRAADAFEKRFPRSVLLPAVDRMPSTAP